MIVVGGVTRLTHSGLSIVEWQPILGTLPPLNQAQWEEVFHKYQQTPEYQQVNRGMSLTEFKAIFWWEYVHRLLGRAIGMVYLLPFLYFLMRKQIDKPLIPWLIGIFLLGGLQGAVGWFMVKSGLVNDPRVSQYRLAAHLGLAFTIYAAMFWVALGLLFPQVSAPAAEKQQSLRRFSWILTGLIFVMVLSGAVVAGIRAGFAYNTFPLMNDHWLPPEIFMLTPWYLNFFNNMATVQFDHRLIAWLLAVLVPVFWFKSRQLSSPRARWAGNLLFAILVVQITLGITTLLQVVPIPLAAAHQAGAVFLFSSALLVNHALR
jgi:cytochrome c oxidase assembly protein subunit 15